MIRDFLVTKYGEFVTSKLLTSKNEVIWDNKNGNGVEEQSQIKKYLKELKDSKGEKLVPDEYLNVDWGMDFSSWIGEFDNGKDFIFIGAEPHISNNYQLVYDFGNRNDKDINNVALEYADNPDDIWYYIFRIFSNYLSAEGKISFLKRCYITDLCHIVPKGCGTVDTIIKRLKITKKDWFKFRSCIAKQLLLKEIETVKPKIIVLHGASSRHFFNDELNIKLRQSEEIGNWKRFVYKGEFNGVKIIAIPHLKGQILNELWRSQIHPERPESIKKTIQEFVNGNVRE